MLKKISILFITLIFLTACGQITSPDESSKTPKTITKTIKSAQGTDMILEQTEYEPENIEILGSDTKESKTNLLIQSSFELELPTKYNPQELGNGKIVPANNSNDFPIINFMVFSLEIPGNDFPKSPEEFIKTTKEKLKSTCQPNSSCPEITNSQISTLNGKPSISLTISNSNQDSHLIAIIDAKNLFIFQTDEIPQNLSAQTKSNFESILNKIKYTN